MVIEERDSLRTSLLILVLACVLPLLALRRVAGAARPAAARAETCGRAVRNPVDALELGRGMWTPHDG